MTSPAWPRFTPGFACFVAAGYLMACDGSGTGRKPIALANLAAEMAAVECGLRSQCTGRPLDIPLGDCVQQTTARLQSTVVAEVAAAVARTTAIYDEKAAGACIEALRTAGCARFQALPPDACLLAFGGKGGGGATCVSHSDCSIDHFCAVGNACPGVCQPRGGAGANCEADRDCGPDWRCPEIGGTCAPPLAVKAACELFGPPCEFGFTCFAPTIIGPGTCEPVLSLWSATAGQTCALLAGYFCAPGFTCPLLSQQDGELPMCAPVATAGGSCLIGVPDPCPTTEYCEGDILSGTGTCTARVVRGAVCRSSRQCAGGDVCDGGVCGPRQPLGGPCASETGCWSRACVGNVCVAPDLCL